MNRDLSAVKDSIDLVSVVRGEGIELKRSGSRHVGLCPFHADHNPSLFVFDDGYFKCFGCGKKGDAIDFIRRLHGCDFQEALKILGIKQDKLTPQKRQEIQRLKRRRELVKTFRKWEAEASAEVGMLCRCCREVLGKIKNEADLGRFGERYHEFVVYQYHLDILTDDNDEGKFALWRRQIYG